MLPNICSPIPELYKKYYDENQDNFNSSIDITLPEVHLRILQEEADKNGVSLNLLINYILLKAVCEIKAQTEGFEFGLPYFDFELFDEDTLPEMIEKYQKILVMDEHVENKAVLLSPDLYEKMKTVSEIEEKMDCIPDQD